MIQWLSELPVNAVSMLIGAVVAVSAALGWRRGASGSAKDLLFFLLNSLAIVLSGGLAWMLGGKVSPHVQRFLERFDLSVPGTEMNIVEQWAYTLLTGLRDFPLFRTAFLIVLFYFLIKPIAVELLSIFLRRSYGRKPPGPAWGFPQRLAGGVIGGCIGVVRAFVLIAILFVYTQFFPLSGWTQMIEASALYQKGTERVVKPLAGPLIERQALLFTQAVEAEFKKILQRRYEIIDAQIPQELREAALAVTKGAETDEQKARALYRWIGTRIQYDWEKVRLYEQERIWREQTPEETFRTRKGVCIDYSRLYAVMAKSVGLQAKVVTGLGADGRGGYGPHAWNEVYLREKGQWVPLDATWVASGGNWFNPPDFYKTHVKDVA